MPDNSDFLTSILYSIGKASASFWNDLTRWIELNQEIAFVLFGLSIVGIGGLSSWLMKKRAAKLEIRKQTRKSLDSIPEDDSSEMAFFVSKKSTKESSEKKSKDPVISDKTRENMATLFKSLKSVPADSAPETPQFNATEQPFQEFEKSTQIRISEIQTDETPQGKFSKMTVEALMIFEEDDLKENLDQWATRSAKKGIQP